MNLIVPDEHESQSEGWKCQGVLCREAAVFIVPCTVVGVRVLFSTAALFGPGVLAAVLGYPAGAALLSPRPLAAQTWPWLPSWSRPWGALTLLLGSEGSIFGGPLCPFHTPHPQRLHTHVLFS